jgi:acyl-coenzyme A thioesterase PaaI-like protein
VTDVTGMPTNGGPPDLVNALNALFKSRIPAMHRLGIRIVELREDFVAGTAPLAGNLNYQSSMYAGTLFGLGEALGAGVFIANFDPSRFTATVRDVQIRYRRPAMTDVRAEASLDAGTIARIKRESDDLGRPSSCSMRN